MYNVTSIDLKEDAIWKRGRDATKTPIFVMRMYGEVHVTFDETCLGLHRV